MDYIRETAITIDYDLGITLVDTTKRSMGTYLRRQGFTPVGGPSSQPYQRFRREGTKVSFPRTRILSQAARDKAVFALKTARRVSKLGKGTSNA